LIQPGKKCDLTRGNGDLTRGNDDLTRKNVIKLGMYSPKIPVVSQ
jgi:hypothetical protein